MSVSTKPWLWLNILALDAALIAVAWQFFFFASEKTTPSIPAQVVLGLSVWLTYMADRLYDVRKVDLNQLLSLRHQFAKKYRRPLWLIWFLVLIANIVVALLGLTPQQLSNGLWLLAFCLLYTGSNQLLSKRFFPKEIFVAIIFACGSIVFMESMPAPRAIGAFTIVCFINCIAIGHKERVVDKALCTTSLASFVRPAAVYTCMVMALLMIYSIQQFLALALLVTLVATAVIYRGRQHLSMETYRVLIDNSLLLGWLFWLI
ncbi:MAG: hypothetical protein ACSHYA_17430 [Opitutaceae bacterium]